MFHALFFSAEKLGGLAAARAARHELRRQVTNVENLVAELSAHVGVTDLGEVRTVAALDHLLGLHPEEDEKGCLGFYVTQPYRIKVPGLPEGLRVVPGWRADAQTLRQTLERWIIREKPPHPL